MRNCAEATYYLRVCGLARLDRDRDGIPCERLCGNTASTHARRLAAQTGGRDLAKMFATASTNNGLVSAVEPAKTYTCVVRKRYCKEMDTCAEARFYLTKCGISGLDGNRDGIPCNSLCRR